MAGRGIIGVAAVCGVALGCGGTDLGAYRHVDEPGPRADAGLRRPLVDSGWAAPVVDAGTSPSVDSGGPPPLSVQCESVPGTKVDFDVHVPEPGVTGLSFGGDGASVFGIQSWDVGRHTLWTGKFDANGFRDYGLADNATYTALGLAFFPAAVHVKQIPGFGTALGLAGTTLPTYVPFCEIWFANADAPEKAVDQLPGFNGPDTSVVARDFAFRPDKLGASYIFGVPRGFGFDGWGTESWQGSQASVPVVGYALAIEQPSPTIAAVYRTEPRDPTQDPMPIFNPRVSDHVDRVDLGSGTVTARVDVPVHRFVSLEVDAAGDTFVAGPLERGLVPDARKIDADGRTRWISSPVLPESAGSVLSTLDASGGLVVLWNLVSESFVVQRITPDGGGCTLRTFPGVASDVTVAPDGRVLVALTGDAVTSLTDKDGAVVAVSP